MRANVYTSITYCVIKTPSNLSRSRRSKISILAMYIHLVEPKLLIKLNIVCNASDNEQKKSINDIRSLSSPFVVKKKEVFSLFYLYCGRCVTHTLKHRHLNIYIFLARLRVCTRLIALSYLQQQYNLPRIHTHTHRNSRNDVCILVRVHICVYECTLKS